VKYLARYVRGGAMSNRRLVSWQEGQVRFRYKDYRDLTKGGKPKVKIMALAEEEFVRRWLQHVPLPGCQMVRGYGLYANAKTEALTQARKALGLPEAEHPDPVTWQEFLERLGIDPPMRCPVCGATLVIHSEFRRGEHPPALAGPMRVAG
jgi:hypothetical protein